MEPLARVLSFLFHCTFWIDQDSSAAFEKPVFGSLIKHLGLFKRKIIKPVLEKFLCLLKVHLYVYECSSTTLCIWTEGNFPGQATNGQ